MSATVLDAEHLLTLQVRAVHAARVSAGEQVVQRHESELARVARRAGDEDPARFEQGPELGIGRRRTRAGRAAVGAAAGGDSSTSASTAIDDDRRC